MKTRIATVAFLLSLTAAFGQEWDDMYFNAKDRAAQKSQQQEQMNLADNRTQDRNTPATTGDSFSARTINPEYIARENSESTTSEQQDYYTPDSDNYTSQQVTNWNTVSPNYWSNNYYPRYYGGWYGPYAGSWYSPYYGYGYYDPWNTWYDPFALGTGWYGSYGYGYGSWYPGWTLSFGYGWGSPYGNYWDPYYSYYGAGWHSCYAYGGYYNYYPYSYYPVVEGRQRYVNYGKRMDRGGYVLSAPQRKSSNPTQSSMTLTGRTRDEQGRTPTTTQSNSSNPDIYQTYRSRAREYPSVSNTNRTTSGTTTGRSFSTWGSTNNNSSNNSSTTSPYRNSTYTPSYNNSRSTSTPSTRSYTPSNSGRSYSGGGGGGGGSTGRTRGRE